MNKYKKNFSCNITYLVVAIIVAISVLLFFGDISLAQVDLGLQQAEQTGLSGADPRLIAARIIQAVLGLFGIIITALVLYAGYLWMTAAGDDDKIKKAKSLLKNAVIGLIIILSSFSLVSFVLSRLSEASGTGSFTGGRRSGSYVGGGGGFPIGVIDSHYPERGQTNVPRNTNIMVSFVEPMMIESVVNKNGTPDDPSDDVINPLNIRIIKAEDDADKGPFVPAKATYSEDGRHYAFDPIDLLGSSEKNVEYQVVLGEGIKTNAGRAAFGNFGAYVWNFEVSTLIDNSPPQIVSIVPKKNSTHPRNVVIQITFNEAMNPMSAVGDTTRGFNNILVRRDNGELIDGRFVISNQYQTVEFITNDLCGTNSCGEDVFCLPGGTTVLTNIRAASVSAQPPAALFPIDGVTDAASNSLDGNADNVAQGSLVDDYSWSFLTTNQIDLTAPVIESVSPDVYATQVLLNAPVSATFSKPLLFSSINRQTVQLGGVDHYRIFSSTEGKGSTINFTHSNFSEETSYSPFITAGVRDVYQNCYRPCTGP